MLRFPEPALSQRRAIRRSGGLFAHAWIYAFALYAQAAQPEAGAGEVNTDIVHLVAHASPLSPESFWRSCCSSPLCRWGIILYKIWQFRRAARQTATFLDVFRKSSKFSEVQAVCRTLRTVRSSGLFQAGYAELNAQLRAGGNPEPAKPAPGRRTSYPEEPRRGRPGAAARDDRRDDQARDARAVPRDDREHHAVHRFVRHGVGDHDVLPGHRRAGSTSLAVVGPGIAEALIATAAGLFAAIPAVYFYNHFTNRVKQFAAEMDDFSLEFLNISERNFT